jgi:TFIIF-interacting CTD phosphatase-like protein
MDGKINIVLDLDNTIISAVPVEDFPWGDESKKKVEKLKLHNMEDYYLVFERPGLQDFLDYIFENFNVSVWSAASKNYVLYIIENIIYQKPGRKLHHIFFSYHCNLSKKLYNGGLKQLDMLWDCFDLSLYNSSNTIIIDDLKRIKKIQPCNCYNIKPFEFTDEDSYKDNELSILKKYLEDIRKNPQKNCLVQTQK